MKTLNMAYKPSGEWNSPHPTAAPDKPITQANSALDTKTQEAHAQNQYEMGNAYATGEGRPMDLDYAKMWWGFAVANGHAEAQEALNAYTPPTQTDKNEQR